MDGSGRRKPRSTGSDALESDAVGRRAPSAKLRGEQTRLRIAEAALALLAENEHPPTAKEIAARAGVSHRLLFHHFKDLEALLGVVATLEIERYRREVAEVPPHLPLEERVERTVRHRAALYESLGHLGTNSLALAGRLQTVADGISHAHDFLRSRLEHTFRAEVDAAGRRGRERLSAIDAAVSWHVWDYLLRVNRLSPTATRRVMTRLLEAAVSEGS